MKQQNSDVFHTRPRRARKRRGCGAAAAAILLTAGVLCVAGNWLGRNVPALPSDLPGIDEQAQPPFQSSSSSQQDWALLLVNRSNPLPDGYSVDTVELDNGQRVDSRIYPALQDMFDAMRRDGVYPVVASGFRTQQEQEQIMDEKIEEYRAQGYSDSDARQKAEEWVALPGTSEHETGLAVDINADGVRSSGQEVYQWLLENAQDYGFIKRYPENKTAVTGIANEPWHYRYVGEDAAREIMRQGLCLEEYLEQT